MFVLSYPDAGLAVWLLSFPLLDSHGTALEDGARPASGHHTGELKSATAE